MSTITIALYQRAIIKNKFFQAKKIAINTDFIWDGLKTGWFMLEGNLEFIAQLWAVLLFGILAWFGYKKFLRK